MPTYNNQRTLRRVIDGVLLYGNGSEIIVVNDGSTDGTLSVLESYGEQLTLISYPKNKGKGHALKLGFKKAIESGFENAITIDSDGQHYPDDISVFIKRALETPGTLLMGARNMNQEGVPGTSSFGNKFSSFWYKVETGISLPDTQTGFRLYPLAPLKRIKLFTTKFETEIEVIVKMAWKNVPISHVNVKVLYDPNERVSHFRPFHDFTRITILNIYFVVLTVLHYLPKRILLSLFKKEFWIQLKYSILQPNETAFTKSVSIGFGFFMGIIPIWGFQLLIGIPLAIVFRMNKVLFVAAANISIPPCIPFIVAASYLIGGFIFPGGAALPTLSNITLEDIHVNFVQYALGAVLLAIAAGLLGFLFTYITLKALGYKQLAKSESDSN